MTPKERAAMQQALIYLDAIINGEGVKPYQLEGTAFTLREVLAEQAEQEPVAWMEDFIEFYASDKPSSTFTIPLYAAPVRTKDLTDDEIDDIGDSLNKYLTTFFCDFARAVIAADREKNK